MRNKGSRPSNGEGNPYFQEHAARLADAMEKRRLAAQAAAERAKNTSDDNWGIDPDDIFSDTNEAYEQDAPNTSRHTRSGQGGGAQGFGEQDVMRYSMDMAERLATRAIEASYAGRNGGVPSFDPPSTGMVRQETGRGEIFYGPPSRPEKEPRQQPWVIKNVVARVAILAVAVGVPVTGTSFGLEKYCSVASGGGVGFCVGIAGFKEGVMSIPGAREIAGIRDLPNLLNGGGVKANTGNTSGNTLPSTQPEIPTDGNPERLTFAELFPQDIPLGAITAETKLGKAKINYGKVSVVLPMTSSRIFKFTARPLLEIGKSNNLTPATPLTVENNADGITVTLDRSKLTVVEGLEGEGRLDDEGTPENEGTYILSGDSTTGYKVKRTSPGGTFAIDFLAKAPLKSSDPSAGKVNPFAKPSAQNALVIGQLFDLRHLADVAETMMANKCVNPTDGTPLQVTPTVKAKIDNTVEAPIRAWSEANKKEVKFIKKGEYAIDAKTVLNQSAKYAIISGNAVAKKVAFEFGSATSDGAKNFTTSSDGVLCTPDGKFIQ